MRKIFIAAALLATTLAGCAATTDADRALIGAGVGAVAADLGGKSVVLGAIGGASAGVICDDLGICKNRGPYYSTPRGIYTYPVIVDGRTVYIERIR